MRKIDGQTVTNAPQPLRLMVTASDIHKGVPMDPCNCAIAVAVKRQVPGCTDARVHKGTLFALIRKKWLRWLVPEYLTREIVAFDRGGRFVPGEADFGTVPPPPSKAVRDARRAARSRSGKVRLSSYTRRPAHITKDVREEARKNEPAQN